MTSTIKVDNIQDQDGNNIINENANTITIGASGDTVTLASGASQSGFGRTGTVDWDTTAKTASFTATSGDGFFVNTTSAAITVTLPASPSAGDIVAVSDYAKTSATNNITLGRNGSNIQGAASDLVISRNGVALTLIYVDATKGWIVTNSGAELDKEPNPEFIVASGGTETTSGDYKIHTFTGPGTFSITCGGNSFGSNTVDYLVIAGGGGGGSDQGGGGGAGGYRESSGAASGCYTRSPLGACVSALPVSAQDYPITVGGGGAGALMCAANSAQGSNSAFSSITSTGGGRGGTLGRPDADKNGGPGGSGGGSGGRTTTPGALTGGSGNTPPVSPPQGNDGGSTPTSPATQYGASGGGATGAGTQPGCTGGAGATSCITASPVARAGGGGGRSSPSPAGVPAGAGPYGPGTDGGSAANATANTGSGGGGAGTGGPTPNNQAGAGGSGIVIIRYKYQ